MFCQRCGAEFQQTGSYVKRFCSRSCANVRAFSEDSNKLRANSNRKAMSAKTPEERAEQSKRGRDAKARKRAHDLLHGSFDSLNINLKRERILMEQESRCDVCKNEAFWNGKPLNFHLDHVSGDRTDETRSNLRLLCPNCHSQTETYCGGNQKNVSDSQLKEALQESASVLQAFKALGLQPSGKNYQRAKRVLADVG